VKKNSSSRNAIFNDNFLPAIALIHDNFLAEQFQILKAIGSSALPALSTHGNIIVCVRLAAAAALTPAALKGGVSLSHFFVLEHARERERPVKQVAHYFIIDACCTLRDTLQRVM
jgi:hypothetical protein